LLKDPDALADAAAVIVDEASMLDLALLDALLAVLPDAVPLVLVGDPGQLASVEAGRVLGDLFEFLAVHDPDQRRHRLLVRNFRAARTLAPAAASARAGDAEAFARAIEDAPDRLAFVSCPDVPALHDAVRTELRAAVAEGLRLNSGLAFLAAHRQGAFGVGGLNVFLRQAWQDAGGAAVEPVLLEASLPDLDLWNGDLGTIERENGVRGFRRGTLFVPEPLLPRHVPGFALTVHKAQGSEFDRVVLVLPDRASAVMSRELLYTGITRARDRVVILGSRTALEAALAAPLVRNSGLRERLAAVSPGAGS
jgi:exodeoxyribonuclease V alpha subunit